MVRVKKINSYEKISNNNYAVGGDCGIRTDAYTCATA